MTILPPGAAPDLSSPGAARAWQAAKRFEAMALGALLAPIFDTVDPSRGPFGGGEGEATWRPMLTQELARHVAEHGGLGLAMPVYRQMLQMQEQARQGGRNGA